MRRVRREQLEENAEMNALMQETLGVSGALLVKLFGRTDFEDERFRARGFETVTAKQGQLCIRAGCFDRGFDRRLGGMAVDAATLTKLVMAELERPRKGRFFLWVHYFDLHDHYKGRILRAWMPSFDRYLEILDRVDRALAPVLGAIKRSLGRPFARHQGQGRPGS